MGRKKRSPPPAFATALPHQGFVPMYRDQLESPAYRTLTAVAKSMYLILRAEYKGPYTDNKIICPYNTFIDKGISRNSIADNLRLLEALGFITCEQGGLYHQPSIYHFTKDWQNIRTMEEARTIKSQLDEEKKQRKLAQKQLTDEVS